MTQIISFILNHWLLFIGLIVVTGLLLANEFLDKKSRPGRLSPQDVINLINNNAAVIIDLRDANKFEKGHIIHSLRASEEELGQKRFEKYKSGQLVLVCTEGVQSAKVAAKLQKEGYLKPSILAGGINAWRQMDLPLVKGR